MGAVALALTVAPALIAQSVDYGNAREAAQAAAQPAQQTRAPTSHPNQNAPTFKTKTQNIQANTHSRQQSIIHSFNGSTPKTSATKRENKGANTVKADENHTSPKNR